ncbi:response regulator transcription factor [Actinomycetospora lemnae]|uniref:Response regulator transcription factor n=1 Tax=Actinomycetospora lemnae TaxID=3019891 RepID=A0ABT5SXA8_9PSEU|nr:response regulator transcription factor [Actinomycetospora sp. DW7H6]MDD7966781.1 response regulator transcription factor [Actinomycetospora sp. DW7H6]
MIVIDDHEVLSSALVSVLTGQGFSARRIPLADDLQDVAGYAGRPGTAGGVALLDLDLGPVAGRQRWGTQLVTPLEAAGWRTLVMSASGNVEEIAFAVEAGARGVVDKTVPLEELVSAVKAVATTGLAMTQDIRRHWLDRARRARRLRGRREELLAGLTDRERQVLDRLAAGSRAASIADEFSTSLATVRSQIRSILRKLEVTSQLEAVAFVRAAERDEQR